MSNLPTTLPTDSAEKVKTFFENYFSEPISYKASEVDTVVGFFVKRGFSEAASIAISTVILRQAKVDNIKIYKLLDTIKGLKNAQINALFTEVLNYNRPKVSTLGYRTAPAENNFEIRNVII